MENLQIGAINNLSNQNLQNKNQDPLKHFYCSEYTQVKQDILKKLFQYILRIENKVLEKYSSKKWCDPALWIFDLNAGSGEDKHGNLGSPYILFDIVKNGTTKSCKLFLIEKNKQYFQELQTRMRILESENDYKVSVHLINTRNENAVKKSYERHLRPNYTMQRYGLCYHDPGGSPNIKMLSMFSKIPCYATCDILINCNYKQINRNRGLHNSKTRPGGYGGDSEDRPVEKFLKDIHRKYWHATNIFVGNKNPHWEWTLLFGTNYDKMKLRKFGFKPIDLRLPFLLQIDRIKIENCDQMSLFWKTERD